MHPDHRSIGELAYRLWQSRGCPEGTAERDWLEAEKQLSGEALPSPYEAEPVMVVPPAGSAAPAARSKTARPRVPRSKPD